MLHAELARKIAPDADDIARSEDVLTSTVFGTLFLASAWPLLMRWTARAQPIGHEGALLPPDAPADGAYWFWPRLHDAEPDVVIRYGAALLVVEAKYLSGKSGGSVFNGETVVDLTDQLVREWRACCRGDHTLRYPPELCAAIEECQLHLIYLVRRDRWAKELRAVEESAKQADDARMYLLTWEDLDDVLAVEASRWAIELRAYLHGRGVAAFRGFAGTLRGTGIVEGWTYGKASRRRGPGSAMTHAHSEATSRLADAPRRFRGARPSREWSRLLAGLDPHMLTKLATRSSAFESSEGKHG